jgi:tetratricopeptide (TPR) repeat protein
MLGQAYLKGNQASKAVPSLRRALELNAGDAQTSVVLAQALLKAGSYRDCVQVLEQANIGSFPKQLQAPAYQIKGACASKGGGDATADLRQVAQMNPNDAKAQFAYGVAALQADQDDAAVQALGKAVQLDGNNPQYLDTYITAVKKKARKTRGDKVSVYKQAIPAAQKLASTESNFDNVLSLGEVQMGAKMYDQAISNFRKAAGMKSSDFLPHLYIGQSYLASQRFAQAEEPLNKALTMTSDANAKRQIQNSLGLVYAKQSKFDEAIAAYNAAGNSAQAERVAENKRIAQENLEAEAHNQEIERLRAEQERLRKEAEALPGTEPPRR